MRAIAVAVYDVCGKNTDGNRNDARPVCRNLSKIPEQRKIMPTHWPAFWRMTQTHSDQIQPLVDFSQCFTRIKNIGCVQCILVRPRISTNAFNHRLNIVVEFRGKLKYPDHNKYFLPRQNVARFNQWLNLVTFCWVFRPVRWYYFSLFRYF